MCRNATFQEIRKVGGKPSSPAVFQLMNEVAQFKRKASGGTRLVEQRRHGKTDAACKRMFDFAFGKTSAAFAKAFAVKVD